MLKKRTLQRQVLLGTLTCLLMIALSTPLFSQIASAFPTARRDLSTELLLDSGEMLERNLSAARSVLIAQGMSSDMMMSYTAVLNEQNVVPDSPDTYAYGSVGAVLVGDRLVVRGNFSNLSSPMRDYATDPVSPPNPNITSAFHIHQGEPTENGPFQYALTVMMDDERSGTAMGEYTLTAEQLQALADGMLYVDLHTTMNRGGELRGILMPYQRG